MNLENICKQTCDLAIEVGKFMANEQHKINDKVIEVKGMNDFVTYVDKSAELKIVEKLKKILPEAGYITEEGTETIQKDIYNWIVDPLDGTTNFIHGVFPYAVSIALKKNDEIVVGVVYEVSQDECFYAWKGSPAFLNEKEINVSKAPKIKDSLLATGFPYNDHSRLSPFLKLTEFFILNSHGIRRPGSAATDLVYVACGRYDGFYEYTLSPWDVAAGALILQQAGGKVSDFSGGDNYIFGREIIGSNALIFDECLTVVKKFMSDE